MLILMFTFATYDDGYYYCQRDKSWASYKFNNSTIGVSGCGITCAAMVCTALEIGATPIDMAELYESIFPNQSVKGTNPKFFSCLCDVYCFEYKIADIDELPQLLSDGWFIIVDLPKYSKWSDNKHYILLTKYDGNYFTVLDPELTKNKTQANKKSRATRDELNSASFYCIRR